MKWVGERHNEAMDMLRSEVNNALVSGRPTYDELMALGKNSCIRYLTQNRLAQHVRSCDALTASFNWTVTGASASLRIGDKVLDEEVQLCEFEPCPSFMATIEYRTSWMPAAGLEEYLAGLDWNAAHAGMPPQDLEYVLTTSAIAVSSAYEWEGYLPEGAIPEQAPIATSTPPDHVMQTCHWGWQQNMRIAVEDVGGAAGGGLVAWVMKIAVPEKMLAEAIVWSSAGLLVEIYNCFM